MASTAVATYHHSPLVERAKYAQSLAAAKDLIPRGLFDNQTGQPSPAKILLVMETGDMLGLHPMAALQGISVIEGKATISPQMMTGLLRAAGHKVIIKRSGTVEGGDYVASCTLVRSDDPENPIVNTFTPFQALRAGLIDSYDLDPRTHKWTVKARSKSGKPLPWEAYTESMCVWRAVGVTGREGGDDVLMGLGYTPEEIGATVEEDGTVIETDPTVREDEEIAAFKELNDKEQMREVYRRLHRDEFWTSRIEAEFTAHLSTLTFDSNPPAGGPGNTGDARVDEQEPVDAEIVTDEDDAAAATEYAGTLFDEPTDEDESLPVTTATVAGYRYPDGRLIDPDEDPDAWVAAEARAHEQGRI
jgi:hypothetical protein